MSNTTNHHLSYLQQLSDLLEDKHKPLAARFGYIAKKIASKHVVHINGADPPKLRHCFCCHAPITSSDVRCNGAKLFIECSLCGQRRRYNVIKKTHKSSSHVHEVDARANQNKAVEIE